MLDKPMCSVGTLAKLFVLSERRIQQLARSGIIPKVEEGGYCIMSSVNAYVLFLREQAKRKGEPEEALFTHERLRLLKAKADRADYENQRLRRTTLEAVDVYQALDEIATLFIACVDALPGRLAFELTGISDPGVMKAKLFAACRQLRNTTGEQLHVLEDRLHPEEPSCPEDQSPSPKDTGSVGG